MDESCIGLNQGNSISESSCLEIEQEYPDSKKSKSSSKSLAQTVQNLKSSYFTSKKKEFQNIKSKVSKYIPEFGETKLEQNESASEFSATKQVEQNILEDPDLEYINKL